MSHPDFLFELELSGDGAFDKMLTDIARAVCDHVGLARTVCDGLISDFSSERARATGAGHSRCDVRFESRTGEFAIVVRYENGAHWRGARALS